MRKPSGNAALWGVFGLVLLGLGACAGGSDPGTPVYDSDEDSEADTEVALDGDSSEGEETAETDADTVEPVTKCTIDKHNNDSDVVASTGGTVRVCLAGETLDGASISFPAKGLSQDAHILIHTTDSLSLDGYRAVGPAVFFQATSKSGSALRFLNGKEATMSFPFDAAGLSSDVRDSHLRVLFKLDPAHNTLNGEGNPPFILPKSPVSITIDREKGLATVENGYFGTYQMFAPETIAAPLTRHYTFRGLSGASMGACATSMLGFPRTERFDILGPLGGCTDNAYLVNMLHDFHFGGFCTYEQITKKEAPDGKGLVDRTPEEIDAFVKDMDAECGYCGPQTDIEHWSEPTNKCFMVKPRNIYATDEHAQGYNHWYYYNNNANFNRPEDVHLFRDLAYSFGNFANYNTASAYLAAGLEGERLTAYLSQVHGVSDKVQACKNLATLMQTDPITGFYDREYNPAAAYPVISFCDGSSRPTGDYDPADPEAFTEPTDLMLAVDFNRNGIRDYGEPVVRQFWEPYADCGLDGVCDADEPGYNAESNPDPNGDDYNPYTNITGTEANGLYDDDGTRHEAYEDVGIDGVACPAKGVCAYDYGEDNGRFDYNPHVKKALEMGGGHYVKTMPAEKLERVSIYMDAGIRDLFNFHLMTDNLFGAVKHASGVPTNRYDDFPSMVAPPSTNYDYKRANYADKGQNVYVRYGSYTAGDETIANGDGCHVGTNKQVVSRLQTLLAYADAHFPQGDYTPVPSYDLNKLVFRTRYQSDLMGRKMVYAVALPPGYYTKNVSGTDGAPDTCVDRYPVLYILHGYGMDPTTTATTAAAIFGEISAGRMQKMITIFPEGQCFSPGQCREDCEDDCKSAADPASCTSSCIADYDCEHAVTECVRGTFYLDKVATHTDPVGVGEGDPSIAPRAQALFELMDYVESHFCVKNPADVSVDGTTRDWVY